jgi:hypothetical protein
MRNARARQAGCEETDENTQNYRRLALQAMGEVKAPGVLGPRQLVGSREISRAGGLDRAVWMGIQAEREMPRRFIFDLSVLGANARSAAAPSGPSISQSV